jgi:hypothetical protein
MTEKELVKQLHKLRQVAPNSEWKKKSREVLLNQISGASKSEPVGIFKAFRGAWPQSVLQLTAQPVAVVLIIVAIVFGGGTISIYAARDTVPGDSFYIAKRISEKAQLALTFNDADKVKLGFEFAGKRAKEIEQVLAEPNGNGEKQAKVEKLTQNFREEIEGIKVRLGKIAVVTPKPVPEKTVDPLEPAEEEAAVEQDEPAAEENMPVFSADLGKDEQGIQVSGGEEEESADEAVITEEKTAAETPEQEEITATTSEPEGTQATSSEAEQAEAMTTETASDPHQILDEAEKLIEEQDIAGALNKLDEASAIIGGGEVKGESEIGEPATTTPVADEGQVLGEMEAAEDASSTVE